jgi:polysaccharide deacetylase 2 family uncharacterized protein YibQ
MTWNNDGFADMLHRAGRPDPAEAPPARLPITQKALANLPVVRRPSLGVNRGYALAALLILGAAIWLAMPRSVHQTLVVEASPAAAVLSPISSAPIRPESEQRGMMRAAELRATWSRIAAQAPQQPPRAPSAEPAAALPPGVEPELVVAAEPAAALPPAVEPEHAAAAQPWPAAEAKADEPVRTALKEQLALWFASQALSQQLPHAPPAETKALKEQLALWFASQALSQQPPHAPSATLPPAAETKLAAPTPPLSASRNGPAWLRFAVAAAPAEGRPQIAVVIDDLGLNTKRTERAIVLPGPVTLSFLAYADDLPRLSEAAHRAGHELLVSVPMEPITRAEDMGPNGLTVGLGHDEMLRRLRWDLDRFVGYVGINNHMGSRFTRDVASLTLVMEELRARGLLFLDARTVGNSAGVDVARRMGVPQAGRDVFLDSEGNAGAIAARLLEVEQIARRHGSAIAIGHARDATIEQLDAWLTTLPGKGFALVPVSAIVREHWQGGSEETQGESDRQAILETCLSTAAPEACEPDELDKTYAAFQAFLGQVNAR